MDNKRIGYACKYVHYDQSLPKKAIEMAQRPFNTRSTTATWLDRQSHAEAVQRVYEIIEHNLSSVQRQLEFLAPRPQIYRMMRIGSDLLPFYTHSKWRSIYQNRDLIEFISNRFERIGQYARTNDIRLSFHPGQFTVLASNNPEIVERSIDEFEYHVDMIRWMGYGRSFQDFKCNVHIGGRLGPDGIRAVYPRLSAEARNTITLENDEMSWGLSSVLATADIIPVVLDIHHHWVRNGEYIQPNDERVQRVIESWRGVRPVIHYSYSRSEHLPVDFDHTELPNLEDLLSKGYRKQKLRAHSDWYPNNVANGWALGFLEDFDIMCESKMKNLARDQLVNHYKGMQ